MQPEAETAPLIMLVLWPYVIDSRCPKMPSSKSTPTTINDLLIFDCFEKTGDDSSTGESQLYLTVIINAYRATRMP